MKNFSLVMVFCLLASSVSTSLYAAEVRVCNKSEFILKNMQVSYRNYPQLSVGECSAYYKDPLAQKVVTIGVKLNGKSLGYRSKGLPILLDEGNYSYNVSINAGNLALETVKD